MIHTQLCDKKYIENKIMASLQNRKKTEHKLKKTHLQIICFPLLFGLIDFNFFDFAVFNEE